MSLAKNDTEIFAGVSDANEGNRVYRALLDGSASDWLTVGMSTSDANVDPISLLYYSHAQYKYLLYGSWSGHVSRLDVSEDRYDGACLNRHV